MSWQILIPDRLRPPADIEQAIFGPETQIVITTGTSASERQWAEADGILLWHEVKVDANVIRKLDRCKVIVRVGVGFENVDLAAAGKRGICVCNVPDYGTEDVADHAMAMILALERGLLSYDASARRGVWSWDAAGMLRRIRGIPLGIIGLGRIGTATALRARAFGMDILFYDPYKPRGYDKSIGVRQVETLSQLLTQCSIVSLHTPLTDETRNMGNKDFFAQMPAGSTFINVARGGCYDLDAIHESLRSGHLRGAGLDVLPEEPPNTTHPLVQAWKEQEAWIAGRLIITPHAAFYNRESYIEMRRKAAEEAHRVLSGNRPLNCVNGQYL